MRGGEERAVQTQARHEQEAAAGKATRGQIRADDRRHLPIPEQGQWLRSVVRGHLRYYAVPDNNEAIRAFRIRAVRHWRHALRRRSQRTRVTWERMYRLEARWIPPAPVQHPWPKARFDARTQGRSPVR